MDINATVARLTALANGPKPWVCITHFADGRTRECAQPRQAMAEGHAVRERRKIGRDLICQMTGATVRVVAVTVEHRG